MEFKETKSMSDRNKTKAIFTDLQGNATEIDLGFLKISWGYRSSDLDNSDNPLGENDSLHGASPHI